MKTRSFIMALAITLGCALFADKSSAMEISQTQEQTQTPEYDENSKEYKKAKRRAGERVAKADTLLTLTDLEKKILTETWIANEMEIVEKTKGIEDQEKRRAIARPISSKYNSILAKKLGKERALEIRNALRKK